MGENFLQTWVVAGYCAVWKINLGGQEMAQKDQLIGNGPKEGKSKWLEEIRAKTDSTGQVIRWEE